MGVRSNIYGERPQEYEKFDGCVLDKYEHNGYDDSDFYAVCWDEETQSVIEIEYDTTRCGGGGSCTIDATEEVLRKAYRYYRNIGRIRFDGRMNEEMAKKVEKGDTVQVVKGRKVRIGTVGKVFWIGTVKNFYSYRDEERVGIEVDGEKHFLPLEYVEVVDWQSRLVHGRRRKQMIRNYAVREMPYWCRDVFARTFRPAMY